MLDDGLLWKFPVERLFGMHNLPTLPAEHFATRSGPIMAGADHFRMLIVGRGGHAVLPHLCADALVAAAETLSALAAAREVSGKSRVTGDCARVMFSEDFGRMLKVKPGCFVFIGNGKDGAALHGPILILTTTFSPPAPPIGRA